MLLAIVDGVTIVRKHRTTSSEVAIGNRLHYEQYFMSLKEGEIKPNNSVAFYGIEFFYVHDRFHPFVMNGI